MVAKLRNTFSQIFAQLKTRRILKSYENADILDQEKFRAKEIYRIGKNKYNMEAYLRLSLMSPRKHGIHCRNSLHAIGVPKEKIASRLSDLQTRYPRIHNALLIRRTP